MDTLFVTLRVVVALGAVLGLLWYVQRRLSRGKRASRRSGAVQVVSRQGLGSKASVVLIEADGTRFLLGVTEQNVTVLHTAAASAAAFAEHIAAVSTTDVEHPDASYPDAAPVAAGGDSDKVVELSPRRAARALRSAPPVQQASGSILNPDTWKQAVAAVRHGR